MKFGTFLIGLALLAVGVILFLSNVTVGQFGLYRYGNVNVGGILIVLIVVTFIIMLVKTNIASIASFVLCLVCFGVSLLMSLDLRVNKMSALELFAVLGTIAVGIALTLRGLLAGSKKNSNESSTV